MYNESVNVLNVRIDVVPDLVIARAFGFTKEPLLQFSSAEKADVDLKALFSA
jgi:LemA protein